MLKTIALIALPFALLGGATFYNASAETCELRAGWNFNGDSLVVRHCVGKLGFLTSEKTVAVL